MKQIMKTETVIMTNYMLILSLIAAGSSLAYGRNEPQAQEGQNDAAWKLVWADEFNENGRPNLKNWTYEHGFVRNEERQWYQPENAFCEDGLLVIEARRERVKNPRYREGSRDWRRNREYAEYTSASLKTLGLHAWKFGRIEVRARIDTRLGNWPAIWTLGVEKGWPANGEVDILEYYQHKGEGHLLANAAYASERRWDPHWDTVRVPLAEFTRSDPDWGEKFHIWRMDWDEKRIRLYLDAKLMNEIDLTQTLNPDGFNAFHQPHYLLLNLAIGAHGGDPGGTGFPCRYEIDYARVYQKKPCIESGAIWPDNNGVHINAHGGGVLYHDGLYYWFGEHKVAGRAGNKAQVGVHVYSSRDLYHWHDDGIALAVSDDPESDIARGCILERPKVIYNEKTKTFVMWFHLELKGQGYNSARSGVAVADEITGPYHFRESFRPDGCMARDQTVFVDDDGKAYHLYASEDNQTLHIGLLSEDYLRPSGTYIRVFEDRYMEAPAILKHDGVYYFLASGCTGWKPNTARSARADSIWGPWTELGNPCRGVNPANGLGAAKTFGGQSTFILPIDGEDGAFIAMFDEWRPDNPIDGRYYWLPVRFEADRMVIEWKDCWTFPSL